MAIETVHLRLLPYSPEHLFALIEGPERFEERFGLPAAEGLRAFLVSDEVSPAWLARLRASVVADPWVHGFAIVHWESRSVIGSAGFKGLPDEQGVVEIAYGIVPGFEGPKQFRELRLVHHAFDLIAPLAATTHVREEVVAAAADREASSELGRPVGRV